VVAVGMMLIRLLFPSIFLLLLEVDGEFKSEFVAQADDFDAGANATT